MKAVPTGSAVIYRDQAPSSCHQNPDTVTRALRNAIPSWAWGHPIIKLRKKGRDGRRHNCRRNISATREEGLPAIPEDKSSRQHSGS